MYNRSVAQTIASAITGIRTGASWEKQNVFLLSNGYKAIVEYGLYGRMITALYTDSECWHCSNGFSALPDFAQEWIEPISPGHWETILRPRWL